MPKVTLITPCYNAERYLPKTLESIQAQTMRDYEHICIDDGSTDSTLQILESYAASDDRVRIIRTSNRGAGGARNLALDEAKGTWVYCIDADDIMLPSLLEEAVACGEEESAELVIFRCDLLDDETGYTAPFLWCFDVGWLGEGTKVFNPAAHSCRMLNSFQNWVHNKLFLRSFLVDHDIRFQEIHRTEELMFTGRVLTEAQRVALLDRSLHLYRTNNPQSSIESSDPFCLDFYDAFVAFRENLENRGLWDLYRESYINWAIEGVGGNLLRARIPETFWTIVRAMRDGGLETLDIFGYPRERAYNRRQWDVCHALLRNTDEELPLVLMHALVRENEAVGTAESREAVRYREARTEIRALKKQVEMLWKYNDDLRQSLSFKAGRSLTAPVRLVRDKLSLGDFLHR